MIPYFDVKRLTRVQVVDQTRTVEKSQEQLKRFFGGLTSVRKGNEFIANINVFLLNDRVVPALEKRAREGDELALKFEEMVQLLGSNPDIKSLLLDGNLLQVRMLLQDEDAFAGNDHDVIRRAVNSLLPSNVTILEQQGWPSVTKAMILYAIAGRMAAFEADIDQSLGMVEGLFLVKKLNESLVTIQVRTSEKLTMENYQVQLDAKIQSNAQSRQYITLFKYFKRGFRLRQ